MLQGDCSNGYRAEVIISHHTLRTQHIMLLLSLQLSNQTTNSNEVQPDSGQFLRCAVVGIVAVRGRKCTTNLMVCNPLHRSAFVSFTNRTMGATSLDHLTFMSSLVMGMM